MTPRSMSFKACRTRAEVEERFRVWVEQLALEAMETFPPDVLDDLDDILRRNAEAIEDSVRQFRAILDREGIVK